MIQKINKRNIVIICFIFFILTGCDKKNVRDFTFLEAFTNKNRTNIFMGYTISEINRSGYKFVYIKFPDESSICLKGTLEDNFHKIEFDKNNTLTSYKYKKIDLSSLKDSLSVKLQKMNNFSIYSVISDANRVSFTSKRENINILDYIDIKQQKNIKSGKDLDIAFLYVFDSIERNEKKYIDSISNVKQIIKIKKQWYLYFTESIRIKI